MASDDQRLVIKSEDLPEVDIPDRIVITLDDLPPDEPQQRRVYPGVNMGNSQEVPIKAKASMIRSNLAQNVIAGLIGGFLGWLLLEPFSNSMPVYQTEGQLILHSALIFCPVGAVLGAALGCAEGVVTRVWPKALRNGAIGLGVGLVGSFIGGGCGQFIYSLLGGGRVMDIAIQILARAIGWGLIGLVVGLGQGIAYQSNKKIINGLLGGLVGGLLGGALFDPIGLAVASGTASRLLAVTLMGMLTGGAIGLVDEMRKEAWLKVVAGHLTGKEYILFNETTTIGSAPKCNIVIYKDSQVAPVQAVIRIQGNRYLINDSNPQSGTYVNSRLITNAVLTSGQTIQIGSTVFSFYLKSVHNIA